MHVGTIATVLVAVAFIALCVWVMRPSNKDTIESHGRIPLDDDTSGEHKP
jgi:cbb3-type cytochrome oxidase subunit 3